MSKRAVLLVCALLPAAATAAEEEEVAPVDVAPAPRPSWVWQNTAAVRLNPLGLFDEARISFRSWLHEGSEARILQNSYLGASASVFASPAVIQAGPDLELAPLAILQLQVGYRLVGYFGTFGVQQGYASAAADWSDDQRSDASGEASLGHMLTAGGLLQLRVGDVVARTNLRAFWQEQDLGEGTKAFYDPILDVLQPQAGLAIVNDADLIWLADERWTLGVRHNFSQSFFDLDGLDRDGTELAEASAFQQRVGPVIGWRLRPDPEKTAAAPMVFLLLHVHLSHRFRTGEGTGPFAAEAGRTVSAAFPYVGIAYRAAGEL